MFENEPTGATPVDPDEAADLLPKHIGTRDELNVWEQRNILDAANWMRMKRPEALSEPTIRQLHHQMFNRTWAWAGRYRTSDKNLGVDWSSIPTEVRNLVEDGRHWISHGTFALGEAALRLHHRLVKIHPFPNGNGRHARLWCDLVLQEHDHPPFVWKSKELDRPVPARQAYIEALQAADANNYAPLLQLFLGSERGP